MSLSTALIVYSGHLRGACTNQKLLRHFANMCANVFDRCDSVLVTYDKPFGRSTSGIEKHKNRKTILTAACINLIRTQIQLKSVAVLQEVSTSSRAKNYYQMVSNIYFGATLANATLNDYAIVLRLRSDAGLGVNALMSLPTWKTLKTIRNNTVVQYGTWRSNAGVRVNGDNAFAARPQTFVRFVRAWKDMIINMTDSQLPVHVETTMQNASERAGCQLTTP